MIDLLRRYFVCNTASIFRIRRSRAGGRKPISYRCANSAGLFWLGFEVSWRMPFAKVWHWDATAKRWIVVHSDVPGTRHRPDPENRILIATIALIVILAWALGGHAIWSGTPLGGAR